MSKNIFKCIVSYIDYPNWTKKKNEAINPLKIMDDFNTLQQSQ